MVVEQVTRQGEAGLDRLFLDEASECAPISFRYQKGRWKRTACVRWRGGYRLARGRAWVLRVIDRGVSWGCSASSFAGRAWHRACVTCRAVGVVFPFCRSELSRKFAERDRATWHRRMGSDVLQHAYEVCLLHLPGQDRP